MRLQRDAHGKSGRPSRWPFANSCRNAVWPQHRLAWARQRQLGGRGGRVIFGNRVVPMCRTVPPLFWGTPQGNWTVKSLNSTKTWWAHKGSNLGPLPC